MRHRCQACGRSCHGVRVPMTSAREARRIVRLGQSMGFPRPLDGTFLATDRGLCFFQGADGRCRIHAEVSNEAKPAACRQYPVVAADTEDGLRLGIDPGCYTAVLTWRDGPQVPEYGWLLQPAARTWEGQAEEEERVLAELSAARHIRDLLPEGIDDRLLVLLQAVDLAGALASPLHGPSLDEVLGPVARELATWSAPPPWPELPEEAEAWALEVSRRMVWLRLVPELPSAEVLVLLVLCGALVAAWGGTDIAGFGARLAAWTRLMRSAEFRELLLPGPEALVWLVRGR